MRWRWAGLGAGMVAAFFITYGLPNPAPHRHAHGWALVVGITVGVQWLLFLLGVIADEVIDLGRRRP